VSSCLVTARLPPHPPNLQARTAPGREDEVKGFAELLKSFDPRLAVKNLDEFRLTVRRGVGGKRSLTIRRIDRGRGTNRKDAKGVAGVDVGSILTVISSDETAIEYYVLVLKATGSRKDGEELLATLPDSWAKHYDLRLPGMPNTTIITKSGLLNTVQYNKVVSGYAEWREANFPGLKAYMLLDNLSLHHALPALVRLQAAGIECVFFPPNLTHLFQPLDHAPFANLKRLLEQATVPLLSRPGKGNVSLIIGLLEALPLAITKTFTEVSIKGSFAACGMTFPFGEEEADALVEMYKKLVGGKVESLASVLDPITHEAVAMVSSLFDKRDKAKAGRTVRMSKFAGGTTATRLISEAKLRDEEKEKEEAEKKRKRKERSKRKREKEIAKVASVCRLCERVYRKNARDRNEWMGCDECDVFWVCPGHEDEGNEVLRVHEEGCEGSDGVDVEEAGEESVDEMSVDSESESGEDT
jgi:hypothetical protein